MIIAPLKIYFNMKFSLPEHNVNIFTRKRVTICKWHLSFTRTRIIWLHPRPGVVEIKRGETSLLLTPDFYYIEYSTWKIALCRIFINFSYAENSENLASDP